MYYIFEIIQIKSIIQTFFGRLWDHQASHAVIQCSGSKTFVCRLMYGLECRDRLVVVGIWFYHVPDLGVKTLNEFWTTFFLDTLGVKCESGTKDWLARRCEWEERKRERKGCGCKSNGKWPKRKWTQSITHTHTRIVVVAGDRKRMQKTHYWKSAYKSESCAINNIVEIKMATKKKSNNRKSLCLVEMKMCDNIWKQRKTDINRMVPE